jgi:mono/diheme cytochrome c family protein
MIRSSGVALALFVSCSLFSSAQESKIEGLTGNANAGKALYRRYCITCHGVHGDGAGENAPHLDPKPRDFTKAAFKCRSTPSGDLPTDSDLYDTISRGIYNSAMPPWRPLTRQQRADLIAYIKTFSPRFHEEPPVASVVIPPEPPTSAESVQRGAALFQSMNCWSCHGKEGRGNGPSALTLTDSKGYPILPFDFTLLRRHISSAAKLRAMYSKICRLDWTALRCHLSPILSSLIKFGMWCITFKYLPKATEVSSTVPSPRESSNDFPHAP